MWRYVLTSIGTRFFVMGATSCLSLLTAREIITTLGPTSYAQYGLLVSIVALLPFADLGISAAVVNGTAEADGAKWNSLVPTLVSAIRILTAVGLITVVLVVALALFPGWPSILGAGLSAPNGNAVAAVCLVLFGASIPFGVGGRILIGLRKNHLGIVIIALQAPMLLVMVLLIARGLDPPRGDLAPACYFVAYLVVNVLGFVVANL